MEETWKDIVGYEGKYRISNFGNVLSLRTGVRLKPCFDKRKYVINSFYKNDSKKTLKIHRLVAEHFIPNPENKRTVNHKDGDKNNNCFYNLEWATDSENIQHAYDNGLKNKSIEMIGKLRARVVVNTITGEEFESCEAAAKTTRYSSSRVSAMLNDDRINKTNLKYKQ